MLGFSKRSNNSISLSLLKVWVEEKNVILEEEGYHEYFWSLLIRNIGWCRVAYYEKFYYAFFWKIFGTFPSRKMFDIRFPLMFFGACNCRFFVWENFFAVVSEEESSYTMWALDLEKLLATVIFGWYIKNFLKRRQKNINLLGLTSHTRIGWSYSTIIKRIRLHADHSLIIQLYYPMLMIVWSYNCRILSWSLKGRCMASVLAHVCNNTKTYISIVDASRWNLNLSNSTK